MNEVAAGFALAPPLPAATRVESCQPRPQRLPHCVLIGPGLHAELARVNVLHEVQRLLQAEHTLLCVQSLRHMRTLRASGSWPTLR